MQLRGEHGLPARAVVHLREVHPVRGCHVSGDGHAVLRVSALSDISLYIAHANYYHV